MPDTPAVDPNAMLMQIFQQMQQQASQVPPPPTPEEMKRQRLRSALAAAGKTMSSTPGNALQGLAAGLGSGASTYNDLAMRQMQQQSRGGDRMDYLRSMLSGAQTMANNQRQQGARDLANERFLYRKERDETDDEFRERQLKARTGKAAQTSDRLQEKATFDRNATIERLLNDKWRALGLDDPNLFEDDRARLKAEFDTYSQSIRKKLQGVAGAAPPASQVSTKADKRGTPQIGQTASSPDGRRIILTEDGWKPLTEPPTGGANRG